MNLSDFDYIYPKELIAQRPLPERDASRMLVLDRTEKSWRHMAVRDLPELLRPGDLLVVNDSKVIPARLFGTRGNGEAVEILLVEPASPDSRRKPPLTHPSPLRGEGQGEGDIRFGSRVLWRCLLKKARRIRAGEQLFFGMHATATARGREGIFLLLQFGPRDVKEAIDRHGVPPLPPYIGREGFDAYTAEDRERYQTVYAEKPGSAAAPTAGLHLSEELLSSIRGRGIEIVRVTLHVGIDTFAPLRTEAISSHRMHGERYEISPAAAQAIAAARREGRRVVAVGTTTVRALESAALAKAGERFAWGEGTIAAGRGITRLFIVPGFSFRVADALLTNFHQPRSTLVMMASAFAGRELLLAAYAEAIRENYRLFSYGDCMLIQEDAP